MGTRLGFCHYTLDFCLFSARKVTTGPPSSLQHGPSVVSNLKPRQTLQSQVHRQAASRNGKAAEAAAVKPFSPFGTAGRYSGNRMPETGRRKRSKIENRSREGESRNGVSFAVRFLPLPSGKDTPQSFYTHRPHSHSPYPSPPIDTLLDCVSSPFCSTIMAH